MSEQQSASETKVQNNAATHAPAEEQAKASAAPAAKAPFVAVLRERGAAWAEAALGAGRVALEHAARALDRAAEKLGAVQEKLKKGDAAAAAGAE